MSKAARVYIWFSLKRQWKIPSRFPPASSTRPPRSSYFFLPQACIYLANYSYQPVVNKYIRHQRLRPSQNLGVLLLNCVNFCFEAWTSRTSINSYNILKLTLCAALVYLILCWLTGISGTYTVCFLNFLRMVRFDKYKVVLNYISILFLSTPLFFSHSCTCT